MERTKETLEARVRETPLADRLKECQQRIGNMCAELRGPKMSIPVEYYDDDFYICTTLADAQATVEALQRERDEANLYRDQARANQESLAACVDRDVRKIKDHSCHVSGCERDDLQQLRDENTRLTNEIKRRIWILHGSRLTHNLYGDDGNMDCNSCFRRYAEATLEQCYDWEIADAAMIVTKAALDGGKGVQGGEL